MDIIKRRGVLPDVFLKKQATAWKKKRGEPVKKSKSETFVSCAAKVLEGVPVSHYPSLRCNGVVERISRNKKFWVFDEVCLFGSCQELITINQVKATTPLAFVSSI